MAIPGFSGMQYTRDGNEYQTLDYNSFNKQYASSSHQKDHDMNPALILKPKGDDDISKAVKYAVEKGISIAVKSGGHQYSGACSTGGKNIQLDLSDTYKDLQILPDAAPEDRQVILAGVSNRLKDVLAYLKGVGLFVPTGQCAFVAVGGHGQTGGYGQMGRSFGLFGDHIIKIRMINHNGEVQEVTKGDELFYAILGGSPGNFGIITHYTLEVYKSKSYMGTVAGTNGFKGPHMLKGVYLYDRDILATILTFLANMSDAGDTPQGYELCVSVLSSDFPITLLFPVLNNDTAWQTFVKQIKNTLSNDILDVLNGKLPALIVVYASWCPVSGIYDDIVDSWFSQFRNIADPYNLYIQEEDITMAKMPLNWVFPKEREFELPYIKRTYLTTSTTLVKDNWPNVVADRIDLIYNPKQKLDYNPGDIEYEIYDHCKLAVQIQAFGGEESQFFQKRNNGTSYSWRDSTMVQVLDCFHDPDDKYKAYAAQWQAENDRIMNGPTSPFSKQDRRVLWGSYGDWDMSKPEVWKTYYEDEGKYKRIGRARAKADPRGTFSANPFAVAASNSVPAPVKDNTRSTEAVKDADHSVTAPSLNETSQQPKSRFEATLPVHNGDSTLDHVIKNVEQFFHIGEKAHFGAPLDLSTIADRVPETIIVDS